MKQTIPLLLIVALYFAYVIYHKIRARISARNFKTRKHQVRIVAGSYFKNKIGIASFDEKNNGWIVVFSDDATWEGKPFFYTDTEIQFLD